MIKISHLFAKATVIYCVAFATLASAYSLHMQAQGRETADLLAVILAFFGGELLLLCLKTVLAGQQRNDSPADRAVDARSGKEGEPHEDPTE